MKLVLAVFLTSFLSLAWCTYDCGDEKEYDCAKVQEICKTTSLRRQMCMASQHHCKFSVKTCADPKPTAILQKHLCDTDKDTLTTATCFIPEIPDPGAATAPSAKTTTTAKPKIVHNPRRWTEDLLGNRID